MFRDLAAIAVAVVFSCSGCVDNYAGTPAAALSSYVAALAGGDRGAAYDILDPQVRADVDGLHAALRASAALVRSDWPTADQQALIERVGASLAERTDASRDYLAVLLGGDEAFRLSRLATWGARPVSAEASDGSAQVSTLAGDSFSLIRDEEGAWRLSVPETFAASVKEARSVAEANLAQLQSYRERSAALRKGTVRPAP